MRLIGEAGLHRGGCWRSAALEQLQCQSSSLQLERVFRRKTELADQAPVQRARAHAKSRRPLGHIGYDAGRRHRFEIHDRVLHPCILHLVSFGALEGALLEPARHLLKRAAASKCASIRRQLGVGKAAQRHAGAGGEAHSDVRAARGAGRPACESCGRDRGTAAGAVRTYFDQEIDGKIRKERVHGRRVQRRRKPDAVHARTRTGDGELHDGYRFFRRRWHVADLKRNDAGVNSGAARPSATAVNVVHDFHAGAARSGE